MNIRSAINRIYRLFVREKVVESDQKADVVDLNRDYDEQASLIMRKVLSRDSNCLDVGCHKGLILDVMLECSPDGQHYGFEPIPALCEELKAKYADRPNIEISCAALSEAAGVSTFQHVVSNPAYSGLQQRRYDRDDEVIEEIQVTTERLDDVIPSDMPVRLIKIDVEGGEVLLFRGALKTISRNKPFVVFEHGPGGADFYGHGPADVYELLVNQCGLKLSTMKNWLEGKPHFSRQEFLDQFNQGLNYYFLAHP